MELNALTRWESIGKDLYQSGTVGREIARIKARSKFVEKQRSERQQQRSEVEETIESEENLTTPTQSRVELNELEKEEAAILAKWRAMRLAGKKLRVEEEKLEQEVVQSARDIFPPGHGKWVYFAYRCLRRFAKGFAFGFLGKFAFTFFGLCFRMKFNIVRIIPEMLKLLMKPDIWRYGSFLGSFLMIFESCIRLLRMKGWINKNTLTRHHRTVRVILSAVIAGSVSIAFLPRDTRLGISMFFVVRALEILVRWLVEEREKTYTHTLTSSADADAVREKNGTGVIAPTEIDESTQTIDASLEAPSAFSQLRTSLKAFLVRVSKIPASNHFDTLVMALASSQVIWAWLFNRQTVEPAYLHFLDHQGGRVACVQHGYVALHSPTGIPPSMLGQINALRSAEGRGELDLSQPLTQIMCNVLHRDTPSCTWATLNFWKAAYLRALPVYIPVYILPMVIFKHRQLLKHPLQILVPTISNLLRSAMFLSSYCTVAWSVACATTNMGLVTGVKGALAGFFGGACVAMEKKGRRVELALYVLSQSLPSTYRTLHQLKILPMIPHGESLCFVAAMAVIMWSYVTRPHLMRSSYLSLFKFFFGSGGRSAGFSTRAVEHSTHANSSTQSRSIKGTMEQLSSQPPILSADPMSPAADGDHLLDGSTIGANGAINGDPGLAYRHTTRLSTVEDVEAEESDGSTSGRNGLGDRWKREHRQDNVVALEHRDENN